MFQKYTSVSEPSDGAISIPIVRRFGGGGVNVVEVVVMGRWGEIGLRWVVVGFLSVGVRCGWCFGRIIWCGI